MDAGSSNAVRLFTIGHSNRTSEEFLSLLKEFGIRLLADVRRYPSSRKFPHFHGDSLRRLLGPEAVEYRWFEALGGRRERGMNGRSPNTGLESPGFRNYADYMMTEAFQAAVRGLLSLAAAKTTAVMCAERFYWKCHRRLLSDFLLARGVTTEHILDRGTLRPHKLTPGAVVTEEGTVIYR